MTDVYTVGQVVPFAFTTRDADGTLANPTSASLSVKLLPSGSPTTVTLANPDPGVFTADWPAPSSVGLYQATFTATGVNAGQAVDLVLVQAVPTSAVTLAELKTYLGSTSWTDGQLQDALDAEQVAQARRCRLDVYGADLAQALKRRVARNLAARAVPVATFTSFEGGTTSQRVPTSDPEIARLEAPYRRRAVG